MKVIIAGSRSIIDEKSVLEAILESKFEITEVVCGEAQGVDRIGKSLAVANGVPVKSFIPNWKDHGKKAGIRRNIVMALYADALVAVWDGKSAGTRHMIRFMRSVDKPVFVKIVSEENLANIAKLPDATTGDYS